MYHTLLNAVKNIPEVYQTTGVAFWDDAHISQSMLEAHLAPDADGASRKHGFMRQSVAWIASLPAPGKRLLDLGCGPGLYAEAFAEKGYEVTGVDFSKRSIVYAEQSAKQQGLQIRYRYQDYLSIDYRGSYDVAALIYCDFGVLPPQSRKMLLQKIYAALASGGLFIVDAWLPARYAGFEDSIKTSYEEGGFWRAEPYLCMQKNRRFAGNHFLEQYVIVTEQDCTAYSLWNHAFTREELVGDLRTAGFTGVEVYGDVAGAEFEEGGATICAVGRK